MAEVADTTLRIDRAALRTPAHSQWYLAWRQFRRHKLALVSAFVLLILFFLVFLAPFLAPYRYDAIDMRSIRKPPSTKHVMGTDDIGRDLFTRVLYGGRISLAIGLFAALVGTLAGAVIGALSGFYGGPVDSVFMRFTDIFLSIPILPILIILAAYAKSSIPVMIVVIGLLSWMPTARVVRGTVLSIRTQDYITAARMMGGNDPGIIVRHILPNTMAPIIVGSDSDRRRRDHPRILAKLSGARCAAADA